MASLRNPGRGRNGNGDERPRAKKNQKPLLGTASAHPASCDNGDRMVGEQEDEAPRTSMGRGNRSRKLGRKAKSASTRAATPSAKSDLPELLREDRERTGGYAAEHRARGRDDDDDHDDDDDDDEDNGRSPFEDSQFQGRPGRKQRGLFTPYWCIDATRTPTQARVLGQLAYWFGVSKRTTQCRARIERGGFRWVYKHYPKLARETRLTEKQVGDAMRGFIRQGIVITMTDRQYGRLLRIDPLKIEQMLLSKDAEDDQ